MDGYFQVRALIELQLRKLVFQPGLTRHWPVQSQKKRKRLEISDLKRGVAALSITEPRREKTGLRGFRPGPTQTGMYKLRKELEA